MSWVVEEWKEGLPTKSLQKIQELEAQLEKLKKERQQRQFQLESLEAAFQKQKQKVESEKSEVTALKRENQSLLELCDNQEKTRQKLSHEQQVKDTQVNILEGQLSASRKNVDKLEQELKRYKNDPERSQQSFNAADMSVCVTPQKSVTVSFTPVKLNDSRYEELQEKYNKEVEERRKLEAEFRILQIKLVNQTSQPAPTMTHRDIARHQSSSSVFSWQQEPTPSRVSSSSHDASLKRNYSSLQYPWEQEETPSKRGFKSEGANRSFCDSSNNSANDQLRSQNQELRSKVNELELRLEVQEKEMKNQLNKLQETQALLDKTQAEKDKTLTKSCDDLARMTVQFEQTVDKCAATEQKLKKVSEELSCQRQNAESARLSLEQRLKEQERDSQQELLRQQNSLKNMEQELNQMKSKLNQESQQAKNEFNSIQSELERATHGKKFLEHEVEDLKQKLSKAEQAVTAGQSHVTDLKRELEDARSRQNAIKSQLDHKTKEHSKLEDECRTANQTLRQNHAFVEELKSKNHILEAEIKASVQKRSYQDSASLESLKATMTTLEKERDFSKELLQKRENDLTEIKNTQATMSEELSTLKNQLHCKEQECKDLSHWKSEYENDTIVFFKEKAEMSQRIKDSETTVQSLSDQITLLENDKKNLHTQIKTLQDILDVRTADLEVQKVNCANLNSQMVSESQKYQKEIQNLLQKLSELEARVKTQEVDVWSDQVSALENELETQKKLNAELQGQHDLLLRNQQELQKHTSKVNGKQESNSTSSKDTSVDSMTSVIREKEEEIVRLSEQLSFAKAEMESVHQNSQELKTKLQELTLLSESWSVERETLTASIQSLQQDVKKLTEESKRMGEICSELNDEKMQWQKAKIDTSEKDRAAEDDSVDGSREENSRQCESLKELVEWKEEVSKIQQENSRLLRANEELSSLIEKLQENEISLNKTVEELRFCLKDNETSLRSTEAKMELLNESGQVKDLLMETVRGRLIDLKSPLSKCLEKNNDSLLTKVSEDGPKEKTDSFLHSLDETVAFDGGMLMDDSLLDITGDSSFTVSVGREKREENLTLLINMDQLTLASANDLTLPLPDLTQPVSQESTTTSPFTSPAVEGNRRSITSEIVDLLLQQTPPQQQEVLSPGVKSDQSAEIKDLLMGYQMEISRLEKEHLSEIAVWRQKLKDKASEMEAKLSAEKAETERLIQELEAARLELQVYDLSAHSLLSFDNDDLTARLDSANQTLCTIVPIGRLSLGSNELQTSGHLTQSPKIEKKCDDEKNITESNRESPAEQENSAKSCQERKRRKGCSRSCVHNQQSQGSSEGLQLKTKENQELNQLVKEREEINQNWVKEIKDLSIQIEKLKVELLKKDQEKQDLDDKWKDFEVERLELLGKIEWMSSEKSQSENKIVELEKELNDSLNAMEILKRQMTELSSIRESFEISSKEWKENYLQTESELRRAKSDKANIENHALSLEAELDGLQFKYQCLQEESEGNLRSFNEIRENLNVAVAEKCQLNQELESLAEEKQELEQMYKKLTLREQELESSKLSSKELIKILEAELRTLKEELKAAKLTAEQLTAERDSMVGLQESEKTHVEELKNEIQRIEEEKKILVNDQEDLQIQVSATQVKNEKLSKALERCQGEKHQLDNNLSSAQEEVALMREGIEKLKVMIEADEKKKYHSMEKLKESERKFDKLNDKIESLERELLMSEENFENAILQTETAKEEAERLQEQKEALEIELKCLRKKLEELEEELQSNREKMGALETTVAAITKTLENKELDYTQWRDNSKKLQDLLQVELDELLAQKALSDQKYEMAMAECDDISSMMKQQKEQLEKAQMASNDFEMTLQKLTLEQEKYKLQLDEKTQRLLVLESQTKDAEEWEIKYSSEVSRFEVECENLRNKNKDLQAALEELEEKVQTVSAENETLQSNVAVLKTTCSDLESQMESTKSEKQTLLNKVAELQETSCGLQNKLQDSDLHIKSIQEQNCHERRSLDEEMQATRRQRDDRAAQLQTAISEAEEMKTSAASLQRELESQAKKHKHDTMEYEQRLLQADSRHQSLVQKLQEQQDGDLARYREQITSLETHLSARKQEIDCLKAANGELNESLCKARQQLAELRQLKVSFEDLKKENAKTCGDLQQWMTSCKELEEEREQLQRRLSLQEEALKSPAQPHDATDMNASDPDMLSEMEELKQLLEEKTLDADESVEKYCNLLIKTHKLEDANDTLKMQVELLNCRLKEMQAEKEEPGPQSLQSEETAGETQRRKSRRSKQGNQTGKRRRESGNTEQSLTPRAATKRVKKMESQRVEEEIEPEGLPEVVKKGFADLPSGKQSPCVLRRTEVPLRRSPRILSQTNSPSIFNARIDNLENIPDFNSPTPGGSKSHVTKAAEEDAAPMDVLSPLSAYIQANSQATDNLCAGKPEKGRASVKASHEDTEEEGTCQVQ
ncbi:Centromere protein F [Pristimantis euphronides]